MSRHEFEPLLIEALAEINDPALGIPLAETVNQIDYDESRRTFVLSLPYPTGYVGAGVAQLIMSHMDQACAVEVVTNILDSGLPKTGGLTKVKHIIPVASGKGGVGKSTTAANLALGLAAEGATVGLLDADIYGPSMGMMFGVPDDARPTPSEEGLLPISVGAIALMSMAFLVTEHTPIVWRGPKASGALLQLLTQTNWGELDYLVVDMPPGTGDVALTLAQKAPVSGAIIVTTPQTLATLDANRGIEMFRKVGIPVLGVVENMAYHVCQSCGAEEAVFGVGGGAKVADHYQVPLLASLPLSATLNQGAEQGLPLLVEQPDDPLAFVYREAARTAVAGLAKLATATLPDIQQTSD